eukprot:scaffold34022_cov64-Phaeocystis_antarctica.AAC.1
MHTRGCNPTHPGARLGRAARAVAMARHAARGPRAARRLARRRRAARDAARAVRRRAERRHLCRVRPAGAVLAARALPLPRRTGPVRRTPGHAHHNVQPLPGPQV